MQWDGVWANLKWLEQKYLRMT